MAAELARKPLDSRIVRQGQLGNTRLATSPKKSTNVAPSLTSADCEQQKFRVRLVGINILDLEYMKTVTIAIVGVLFAIAAVAQATSPNGKQGSAPSPSIASASPAATGSQSTYSAA